MPQTKNAPHTPAEIGAISRILSGDTRIDDLRQNREEMESLRQAMYTLRARLERLESLPSEPELALEMLTLKV